MIFGFHNGQRIFFVRGLLILCCSLFASGCISTKELNQSIKDFDKAVVKDTTRDLIFSSIKIKTLTVQPAQSFAKKTFVIALPLLVFNIFQTNHRVYLGQSSMRQPVEEVFRNKLFESIKASAVDWNELQNKGYVLDITIQRVSASARYASGYAAAFGMGGGGGAGKIDRVAGIKSELVVSYQIKKKDSLLFAKSFGIQSRSDGYKKCRIKYIDSNTGQKFLLKEKDYSSMFSSKDQTIPLIIDMLNISVEAVAEMVVKTLHNTQTDFAME